MYYNYTKDHQQPTLRNNNFYITNQSEESIVLEKYTFSNALSLSVKLGIWEASLDNYVDSMAYVTEDLKQGNKIKITRPEMLSLIFTGIATSWRLFTPKPQITLASRNVLE